MTRHADADWRLGRPVDHGLAHLLVVGDGLDEVLAQVVRVVHNGCAEDLIIYHVDGIGELAKQRTVDRGGVGRTGVIGVDEVGRGAAATAVAVAPATAAALALAAGGSSGVNCRLLLDPVGLGRNGERLVRDIEPCGVRLAGPLALVVVLAMLHVEAVRQLGVALRGLVARLNAVLDRARRPLALLSGRQWCATERRRAVLPSDAAEAGARGVGVASARGRADAEAVLEGGHQAVELVRIVQRAEEVAQHLGDRVGVVPRSIVLHRDLLGDEDGVEVMSDERLVEYVGEHAAAFGLLQVLVDMDLELVEVLVHLVRRAVWLGCCANPVGVRLVGLADALVILAVELRLGVEQDLVEHGRAVDLGRAYLVRVLVAEALERVWC